MSDLHRTNDKFFLHISCSAGGSFYCVVSSFPPPFFYPPYFLLLFAPFPFPSFPFSPVLLLHFVGDGVRRVGAVGRRWPEEEGGGRWDRDPRVTGCGYQWGWVGGRSIAEGVVGRGEEVAGGRRRAAGRATRNAGPVCCAAAVLLDCHVVRVVRFHWWQHTSRAACPVVDGRRIC